MLQSFDGFFENLSIVNQIHRMVQQSLLVILIFWLLQFAYLLFDERTNLKTADEDKELLCIEDKINYTNICRPRCQHGYFSLPGMTSCDTWLTCSEIEKELQILEPLTHGAVKTIYKAEVKGYIVAYSVLRTQDYQEDFNHGLKMLKELQPSHHATQLVGFCGNSFVTEYHPLGTAQNVNYLLNGPLAVHDDIKTRFDLCVSYVRVIHFLHSSPIGTRVMCDSNDIDKTLSQFLLNPDLTLVANDLDALPQVVNGVGIKCGHRELFGDFVAPEQLWPYANEPFDDDLMRTYNEKTDIWKIPDVCNHFLSNSNDASFLQFHLYQIHKRCKDISPKRRPNAEEILNSYQEIKLTLGL